MSQNILVPHEVTEFITHGNGKICGAPCWSQLRAHVGSVLSFNVILRTKERRSQTGE